MIEHDEIRADLAVLKAQHQSFKDALDKHVSSEEKFQKEILNCLIGNGRVGLMTRVDRIEQRHLGRARVYWVLVAAVTTSLAEAAWRWVKKS